MLTSVLFGESWIEKFDDIEITGIAYDSRKVQPGNVFVCIKGFETDGHKYVDSALKNGAAVIVAEDEVCADTPVWYVSDARKTIAELACRFYDYPSSKFKLVCVTGTNGKIKCLLPRATLPQLRTPLNCNSCLLKCIQVRLNMW